MTPTPDTTPAAVEAMCERLEQAHVIPLVPIEQEVPRAIFTTAAHMTFSNPDGPEAAAMLREVARERDRYRELASTTHRANMVSMGEADKLKDRIDAAEAEAAALREALREIEALEIDWRLSTAENMRAASDLARAALKETSDGL